MCGRIFMEGGVGGYVEVCYGGEMWRVGVALFIFESGLHYVVLSWMCGRCIDFQRCICL